MRKLIELSLLVLCLPILMGADVYRWVDANGVVNYTQLKPAGIHSQQISTGAAGSMMIAESGDQPAGVPGLQPDGQPELTDTQQSMLKDLQNAEQERQQEFAGAKQANCTKSRDVLDRLTRSDRIRVRDNSGGERVMDQSEREQRISDAQRGIAENCIS
jgi:hypothetical protein